MKGHFPFKLGCTSYIYPAEIIPNVEQMAGFVDDIELLFYEWPENSPALTDDSCQILKNIAIDHNISYTVHFPLYFSLSTTTQMIKEEYLRNIINIITKTATLNPYAYILHLEGVHFTSTTTEVSQWQAATQWLCEKIVSAPEIKDSLARIPSGSATQAGSYTDNYKKICIENLNYPLSWHTQLASDFGFSLCLDVGHLWKYQPDEWFSLLHTALPKTRVIHLHGEKERKDHISLKKSDPIRLKVLLDEIRQYYNHILTIEVFNEKDIFESLSVVNELWQN